MPALLTTVLSDVPHQTAGSASGVLSTVQQVALALGVAVIGSVFFAYLLMRDLTRSPLAAFGAPEAIRVSVGTDEENLVFRAALGQVLSGVSS